MGLTAFIDAGIGLIGIFPAVNLKVTTIAIAFSAFLWFNLPRKRLSLRPRVGEPAQADSDSAGEGPLPAPRRQKHAMPKPLLLLPAAALVASLAACTSVTIVDRDGATKVSQHFGFVGIEFSPQTDAVVAEVTSLGYHGGPLGVSLGFNHTVIAATARDCRLIVWLRNREDVAHLDLLLGKTPGLCIVDITSEEKP
jgi:hypothetical protein